MSVLCPWRAARRRKRSVQASARQTLAGWSKTLARGGSVRDGVADFLAGARALYTTETTARADGGLIASA